MHDTVCHYGYHHGQGHGCSLHKKDKQGVKMQAPSYAKTLLKSFGGGLVIGAGCAILFKGSLVGAAIGTVGGIVWGGYCGYEYLRKTQEYALAKRQTMQILASMEDLFKMGKTPQEVVSN